jgi:hypothetical protein
MSSWHFIFDFLFSSVLGEEVGIEGLLCYLGGCWVEEREKGGAGGRG